MRCRVWVPSADCGPWTRMSYQLSDHAFAASARHCTELTHQHNTACSTPLMWNARSPPHTTTHTPMCNDCQHVPPRTYCMWTCIYYPRSRMSTIAVIHHILSRASGARRAQSITVAWRKGLEPTTVSRFVWLLLTLLYTVY